MTIYLKADGSTLIQRTMATTSLLASKSPVLGLALVGRLNVIATNAATGLNYTRSSGPVSPIIVINNYKMSGTVEEFCVSYANSASFSIRAATHRGDHTIQNSSAPTLYLESLQPSTTLGRRSRRVRDPDQRHVGNRPPRRVSLPYLRQQFQCVPIHAPVPRR
ncbi:hypothetical protein [Novosphingobium sp. BW1]|uniref:hypothetical protein n=1 Tax=Novosphingobium sp. BW1 TaxID=2592621 RepID=UPI0011DEEEE6|nr:hypothetical protein [Novosphingobium sp. BW1]TYC85060.1 hypothetical protein FMM79_18370 [Novosphingobium sp. BW1]